MEGVGDYTCKFLQGGSDVAWVCGRNGGIVATFSRDFLGWGRGGDQMVGASLCRSIGGLVFQVVEYNLLQVDFRYCSFLVW